MPRKIKFCKDRRKFLIAGGIGSAALLLGIYFKTGGELPKSPAELWRNIPDGFHPNAWLSIDSNGTVTVRVNHSEMGQGITTALAMIIAEELEADWDKVDVQIAPAAAMYKNPAFNTQMTAASTSVRTSWDILRKAGATAREMLIAAAAGTWHVPAGQCRAETGMVIHNSTPRKLGYGGFMPWGYASPMNLYETEGVEENWEKQLGVIKRADGTFINPSFFPEPE